MIIRKILLFICATVILFSCSTEPDVLLKIDKQIAHTPNSEFHQLQDLLRNYPSNSEEKAYAILLLYKSAEASGNIVPNDELVQQTIGYYYKTKNFSKLAALNYYYAFQLYQRQMFSKAATVLFEADHYAVKTDDAYIRGKSNLLLGVISAFRSEFKLAESKITIAIGCFKNCNDNYSVALASSHLNRIYRFKKQYSYAINSGYNLLSRVKSAELRGFIYFELALCYYAQHKYLIARHYFLHSLKLPYKASQFATRNLNYAELLFDLEKIDSAYYYAKLSLNQSASYYHKRDAYRIMTNYMYLKNDIKTMGNYMSAYQKYSDSVRILENQEKVATVEKIYTQSLENEQTSRANLLEIIIILLLIAGAGGLAVVQYRRISMHKQRMLNVQTALEKKNESIIRSLKDKIEGARLAQTTKRKKASPEERIQLDIELYEACLMLGKKDQFYKLINTTFNNMGEVLSTEYKGISHKEIVWCCMHLLEASTSERMHVFDASSDSLYKLKQRLAHKLNLHSARDVDNFLQRFV